MDDSCQGSAFTPLPRPCSNEVDNRQAHAETATTHTRAPLRRYHIISPAYVDCIGEESLLTELESAQLAEPGAALPRFWPASNVFWRQCVRPPPSRQLQCGSWPTGLGSHPALCVPFGTAAPYAVGASGHRLGTLLSWAKQLTEQRIAAVPKPLCSALIHISSWGGCGGEVTVVSRSGRGTATAAAWPSANQHGGSRPECNQ